MGSEQMNRAISGMDGMTRREQAVELAQAMSAFKLEAYAAAQMQRAKPAVAAGATFPALQLRAA